MNQNFSVVSSVLFVSSASSASSNENALNLSGQNIDKELFSRAHANEKLSQTEIFVFDSLTDANNFYFINKNLTSCNCEAYKYCKLSVKSCKHLKELKDNFSNNDLFIINKNDRSCNCTRFISNKNCKHISKFNKSIEYLNEICI